MVRSASTSIRDFTPSYIDAGIVLIRIFQVAKIPRLKLFSKLLSESYWLGILCCRLYMTAINNNVIELLITIKTLLVIDNTRASFRINKFWLKHDKRHISLIGLVQNTVCLVRNSFEVHQFEIFGFPNL